MRRGLDPRTDPSTRRMQMLEFRMPSQWFMTSAGQPKEVEPTPRGKVRLRV